MSWRLIQSEYGNAAEFWQKIKGKTISGVTRQGEAWTRILFTDDTALDVQANKTSPYLHCQLVEKTQPIGKLSLDFFGQYNPEYHGTLVEFFDIFLDEFRANVRAHGPQGYLCITEDWEELKTQLMRIISIIELDWRNVNDSPIRYDRIQCIESEKLSCDVFGQDLSDRQFLFRIYPTPEKC